MLACATPLEPDGAHASGRDNRFLVHEVPAVVRNKAAAVGAEDWVDALDDQMLEVADRIAL